MLEQKLTSTGDRQIADNTKFINKNYKVVVNNKEIDPTKEQLTRFAKETNDYSITPTTFLQREFETSIDNPVFKDHFKNYSVLRFGLNVNSTKLLDVVKFYNSEARGEKIGSVSLSTTRSDTGKNVESINNYRANAKKILTEYETNNTEKAIFFMKEKKFVATVVDVFRRDSDGKIVIKDNTPEIHATVLYAYKDKYLVVDPSSSTFSTILAGVDDNILVSFSSKLHIYKAKGNDIGPKLNQWRDCIDIAVKLAFNLTVNSKLGYETITFVEIAPGIGHIDVKDVKNSPSVKDITNQQEIEKNLPSMIEELPIRNKQSSEVSECKKTTALLLTLEYIFTKIENIFTPDPRNPKIGPSFTHLKNTFMDQSRVPNKVKSSLKDSISTKINLLESNIQENMQNIFKDLGNLQNFFENDIIFLKGEMSQIDQDMSQIM